MLVYNMLQNAILTGVQSMPHLTELMNLDWPADYRDVAPSGAMAARHMVPPVIIQANQTESKPIKPNASQSD